VLAALESVSDHLPVVADYQLPAKMSVCVDPVPPRSIRGEPLDLTFSVENAAPASVPIGADRLQYAASGSGDVRGALIDSDDPLGGGNQHRMTLDTDSVGLKRGTLFVGTTSPQVPDAMFDQTILYRVVDHSNGSFDPVSDQNTWTVELGSFPRNSGDGLLTTVIPIYNLSSAPDFTASLRLELSDAAGDARALAVQIPPAEIPAGRSAPLQAVLNTSRPGDFSSTWTIATRDEPIPGSAGGADLVLHLTGSVMDAVQLQAGDANQDLVFDQSDIVRVLQSNKYRTAAPATWGDGDWNGAPGGPPGSPPVGDGVFDQLDVVAALQSGHYLQGAYATLQPDGVAASARACAGPENSEVGLIVPEPAGLALLTTALVCVTAFLPRRRSQHPASIEASPGGRGAGNRSEIGGRWAADWRFGDVVGRYFRGAKGDYDPTWQLSGELLSTTGTGFPADALALPTDWC
jgi:hypothetical protein